MRPKTILIIEDDPDISALLDLTLKDAGYRTLTAESGTRGLMRAREGEPDLVVLDLGLPDFPGDEVARRLRDTSDVPILVLTAVDDPDRKVNLLFSANDYLVKPFNEIELVARVRVQFRRREAAPVLTNGPLTLDVSKRLCTWDGREVHLSPRELDLLLLLAGTPGRAYSREEIGRAVWGDVIPAANVIDVHVSNLRGKLRDAGAYRVVRTVRGFGFAMRNFEEAKPGSQLQA
ncbi:response regulator transcription factor [Deinococcus pimensis]|uniref:response regulator transcription factor n=1 Tax=Deinococcus pimensis TaxID=309888 RepID=UPI0004AFC835|nr:response regulator transcription factor [Deinococcus pimensis]